MRRSLSKGLLAGCLLGACLSAHAQRTVGGKVTDAASQQPLAGASVMLLKADERKIMAYTFTDAQGHYRLTIAAGEEKNGIVEFSMMGYAKEQVPAKDLRNEHHMALREAATQLNEVLVRARKLWQEHDTVNYDVSQFKAVHDRVIGDVLKKLPGVEVAPGGTIYYRGKPINKFYIEGLDALDGRYGLVTKNLPADAVSKVQVLENHQPIKALEKNTFSDQAAINLLLKDGVKSKWIGHADLGLGAYPLLWDSRLTLMQISRALQSINLYKNNNTGENITDELQFHNTGNLFQTYENTRGDNDRLSLIAPATPELKENRTFFNNAHLLSSNNLWKWNRDYQLRANLNYLYEEEDRHTEAQTVYYLPGSALRLSEIQESKRYLHQADATLSLTSNTADYYLMNKLHLRGKWSTAHATTRSADENIRQSLNTPNHFLSNDFQWMKNTGRYNWQVASFNSYSLLPQELLLAPGNIYGNLFGTAMPSEALCQQLRFTSFFSNTHMAFKTGLGRWQLSLSGGLRLKVQQVNSALFPLAGTGPVAVADSFSNDFHLLHQRYLLQPAVSYQGYRLKATLSLPLHYHVINARGRLLFNPLLRVGYEVDAHWQLEAFASLSSQAGDVQRLVPNYVLYNYRHLERNGEEWFEEMNQALQLSAGYRNTVNALFGRLALTYYRGWSNRMYDQSFEGLLSRRVPVGQPGERASWMLSGEISKTMDAWHTTFRLTADYTHTTGEQFRQHILTRYAGQSITLRPRAVVRLARRSSVEYEGALSRAQVVVLRPQREESPPVFSMSHFLTWSLSFARQWQGYVRAEYFYNHTEGMAFPAVLFADAGLRYSLKRVDLSVDCKNIFNTKEYRYAAVSDLREVYQVFALRPASVLCKVSFSF
jgi:hypothetical protein